MASETETPESTENTLSLVITAATTGIGQTLTRKLTAAGHKVAGFAANNAEATIVRDNGGLPVYGDLTRAGEVASVIKMAQADTLVNLLPQVPNGVPFGKNDWDHEALLTSTRALVDAAAQTEIKFIVQSSYAFIYGDHDGATVTEATEPRPGDNALLLTAIQAEQILQASDIPTSILRMGYVYGPQSKSTAAMRDALSLGRPIMNEDAFANWLHEDDAAEALVKLIANGPDDAVFNITDNHAASTTDFLNAFAGSLGLNPPGRPPAFLNRFVGDSVVRDLINLSVQVSSEQAMNALDWQPQYTDFHTGIEHTLLSWRATQVG